MNGRLKQLAVNEEGFAFDPSSGDSFTLNAPGLTVLKGLKNDLSPNAIRDEIVGRYDVEEDEAERDIADFMERLRHFKLI